LSAAPPIVPFSQDTIPVVWGKTTFFNFQILDRATGNPINASSWNDIRFLVKRNLTDADSAAVITLSVQLAGISPVLGHVGLYAAVITDAQTLFVTFDPSFPARPVAFWAELAAFQTSQVNYLWQGELLVLPTAVKSTV
jgi:hypothetical protein